MAINVSQSFKRTSANPIDESMALTKAQMLTVNDNLMPSKYLTICQDDGQIYLYDKSNTEDPTTGKFRVFEGGTEYTAGDGIDITDEEISLVPSESTDMDEIVDDLPPITPIDLDEIVDPVPTPAIQPVSYSTAEHIVGTWYNGKTLYEKTYILDALSGIVDGTQKEFRTETGFSVNDVDEIFVQKSYLKTSTGKSCYQLNDAWFVGTSMRFARCSIETNTSVSPITEVIMVRCNRDSMNTMIPVVTVRYTKP